MLCGLSTFTKATPLETTHQRFRCKSWNCKRCAPKRLARLSKEAYLGRPTAFLTLTTNESAYTSPHEAARHLVIAFRRMREEIQRKNRLGPIPFIAIFEQHKNGMPHLHILWRGPFIRQAWISMYMKRRMNSPIVWITKIKSRKKAAAYCAKYIGKAPHAFEGCKRYWRNPSYIPANRNERPANHTWTLERVALEQIAEALGSKKTRAEMENIEAIILSGTDPPVFVPAA